MLWCSTILLLHITVTSRTRSQRFFSSCLLVHFLFSTCLLVYFLFSTCSLVYFLFFTCLLVYFQLGWLVYFVTNIRYAARLSVYTVT